MTLEEAIKANENSPVWRPKHARHFNVYSYWPPGELKANAHFYKKNIVEWERCEWTKLGDKAK